MNNEKYLGESSLLAQPKKQLRFLLGDKAVKTHHIDNGAVTGEKIADGAITMRKFASEVQTEIGNIVSQAVQDLNFSIEKKVMVTLTSDTESICSIEGLDNSGKTETIIYTNPSATDLLVVVPTVYKTPSGQPLSVLCPSKGYCEVSYMNIDGVIYARGI